jgi:hypothetical protein
MRQRAARSSPTPTAWRHLLLGGLLTLATATPGAAQVYRTTAFLPSIHNECVGAPDCISDVKPAIGVPARGRVAARFTCPESHGHLWGWDVGQHEHIGVKLVAVDRTSATVEATSAADADGHFVVTLGCSTAPYAGFSFLTSRHLAPTGWLPPGLR